MNNLLGSRIKILREENKLTQNDLAKKLGFKNYTTITKWEKGENLPRGRELKLLAELFDVSSDWILGLSDSRSSSDINHIYSQLTPPRQHKVYTFAQHQLDEQNGVINIDTIKEEPTEFITEGLYGRLSAGTGQQIFDNPVEDVKVPSAIIPDEPYDIMLKIVGDSMQPAFEDGEYVFIKLTKEIRSGQFAAIIVDDEAFLKKVYVEEDQMRLVSLNKDYEDIIVNEYSNVEVVGTVVL